MNTSVDAALKPPGWMRKAEKTTFARLILARFEAGRPIQAIEFDALCDLVAARSRLDTLRKMLAEADFPAERLAVLRGMEATTATARKLAKDLHLATQRA